jgi:hypothetical protein
VRGVEAVVGLLLGEGDRAHARRGEAGHAGGGPRPPPPGGGGRDGVAAGARPPGGGGDSGGGRDLDGRAWEGRGRGVSGRAREQQEARFFFGRGARKCNFSSEQTGEQARERRAQGGLACPAHPAGP